MQIKWFLHMIAFHSQSVYTDKQDIHRATLLAEPEHSKWPFSLYFALPVRQKLFSRLPPSVFGPNCSKRSEKGKLC